MYRFCFKINIWCVLNKMIIFRLTAFFNIETDKDENVIEKTIRTLRFFMTKEVFEEQGFLSFL